MGKWFAFGFIAFLAECGEGGSPVPFNPLGGFGGGSASGPASNPRRALEAAVDFIRGNASLVIATIAAGTVLVLALTTLVLWLSSRGTMMAFRAIALDHVRTGEHWAATREAARSYFGFRLLLAAIHVPVFLGALAWGSWTLYATVRALVGPLLLAVVFGLVLAPVRFVGRNILAPMLLRHGGGLRAGWARTMAVVRASVGGVAVFMLVRILISIVQAIGEIVVVYATCCIGGLWVVHETLAAPLLVFERAFTLFVFESVGPDYKIVAETPPWQPPYAQVPPAGYGGGGYGAPPGYPPSP